MKSEILKLRKNKFVRNVMIIATGTAAAQIINIILTPIITRLYGPSAFGLLGVFNAIVGIIAPIAALTYPFGIVLPKKDKDAIGLVRLSIYITIGMATFIALILFLFKQPIVQLFKIEDVAPFLYLIPIVILLSGFLQVFEQWLIRIKEFGVTAKVSILHALILQGSKVGIGIIHPVATILIIISAFGNGLKALMIIIFIKRTENKLVNKIHQEQVSIKEISKKYKDFPLYTAPQVFIDALTQSIPVLMLTSFFGPASVGFYSIGRTVLGIPSNLIGKSVGDVFYPRITEAANSGENLTDLIKRATFALGAIGLIPYGILIAFGPWLFSFIFGEEWLQAGEYARWLALWIFFMFINQPSVRALPVLSAQAFHLKFTIFSLLIRTVFLAIGYYLFDSDLVSIALFAGSGAVLSFSLILITLRISKIFDNRTSIKN